MKLSKYRGKTVKVIDVDNKVHFGRVDLYTPAHDNDGEEALALSNGIWFDESDIKTIELA